MKIELVTLDAAGTLLEVNWNPGQFAIECATACDIPLDMPIAQASYERMLYGRWATYQTVNRTRDEVACDAFWEDLTADWLKLQGRSREEADRVIALARERLYGPAQQTFLLFEDVVPTVRAIREKGLKVAILSNWDYSLHRVLRLHGIYDLFDRVFASLEEGPEKPDPDLFRIVLDHFRVRPENVLHVGDDPLDDLQGARLVGINALLLDRSGIGEGSRISTLQEVLKHLE